MDTRRKPQIELELYFLIAKFLEDGPLKATYNVLKEELEEHKLLPRRVDWEGNEHFRSYEDLANRHISPKHLLYICQRICPLVDKEVPPYVKGVTSLLGAGSQHILRTREGSKNITWSLRTNTVLRHRVVLCAPSNLRTQNFVKVALARELCGVASVHQLRPGNSYTKISQLSKALGHLSAVYCVLFDKTGEFIITGADDHLVKIWSALTGRLLSTLRGHSAEITDMAVSFDNRLLACGSCDKTVRVWNLKTTAPVAVLHAHTGMITSIAFCPSPRSDLRYLASTGSDGCVCFWSWNPKTTQFNPKPTKFIEKSRAGARMLCSSFSPGGIFLATGNNDHVVRIYSYNYGVFEKIAELDAHTDRVDSIQYCNRGTRFVSGSADGTARIWRYERQNWISVVLRMSQIKTEGGSTDKPCVSMVSWSMDDQFVMTAVTDCSIRVWNSHTGILIHTLKGHEEDAFVLENNPVDDRIMLSAGHDGLIIIWDIVTGTLIKKFHNDIQGQGHGAVFDCKWAPHGLGFAATDSHGFLRYFSYGSGENFKKIPGEVFFHTDYRSLIRDSNNFVLDEQTQQPPHLMAPPFLVDMDGGPHKVAVQRLVPGRERYPDKYLVPQVGITPSGDREVLDESVAELTMNEPVTPGSHGNDPDILDHMIERMQREQDERISAAGGDPVLLSPDANRTITDPLEGTSANSADASQESIPPFRIRNTSVWLNRTCIKPLNKPLVRKGERTRNAFMDQEIKCFTMERKKKPLPSEDSSDSTDHVQTRHHKTTKARPSRSQDASMNEERAANRLTTRALYDTEVEDEGEDEGALDIPSDEGWCSSGESSSEYSDWAVDGETTVLQPPKRRSERRVKRNRKFSSSAEEEEGEEEQEDDEETEIDEGEEASDHDSAHSGPSQRVAKPKPVVRRKTPVRRKQRGETRRQRQKRQVLAQPVTELADDFRPPEWLSDPIPRKTPYFPQMGDEVIYCRQGHELYAKAVHRLNVYKIDLDKGLPWHKMPNLREHELVKVVGIKYEFKKDSRGVRLVCLKLASIDPVTSQLNGWSFTIKYHDMPDVVDFLVLRQAYDHAVANRWRVGDRFRSMIDSAWWFGRIHSHTPYQETFPDSLFLCYFVKWDNGEEEKMSPWDFEPIADTSRPSTSDGVPLSVEEIKSLMYQPQENEWPPHGRDEECDRIISGLEQIMELSVAENFAAPVDLNAFPLYAMVIEYPIDLSLIKARVENRFYRRVTSVQYDVRYIESNTLSFNQPGSEIVQKAKLVAELCLRLISDPDCYDVMPIYTQLTKDTEFTVAAPRDSDTDSNHSGPSRRVSRRRAVRRPSRRNSSASGPDVWKEEVADLLDVMSSHEDGNPFREPVDPIDFPDYFDRIDHPMDFGTIRNHLLEGSYDNPLDFCKDVRLVFSNSKTYNTNKRSRIYSMTVRLSILFEDRIKPIIHKWKVALKESKQKSSHKLPSKVHKLKLNAERSLRGSPRKSEAGTSRGSTSPSKKRPAESLMLGNDVGSFKFVVKRMFSNSTDNGEDDANEDVTPASSSSRGRRGRADDTNEEVERDEQTEEEEDTEIDSEYEHKPARSSRTPASPPRRAQRATQSQRSAARYTTRTKTGSVKRKHYDHMSESDHDSPVKLRKVASSRKFKSESDEEEITPPKRQLSPRKNNSLGVKARQNGAPMLKDGESESETETGESTDSGSENETESDNGTDSYEQSPRSAPSRSNGKGKSKRLANGRGKTKRPPSSGRSRRGTTRPSDSDDDEDQNIDHSYSSAHPSSKNGRRSARNRGKSRVKYDEDSDDDMYSPRLPPVSSRGRVRKPRGFFDES